MIKINFNLLVKNVSRGVIIMNKAIFYCVLIVSIVFLFAGCQSAQEGTPKDVSYVSIDQIKVNSSTSEVPPAPDLSTPVLQETNVPAENTPTQEVPPETPTEENTPKTSPEVTTTATENKEIVIITKETDLVSLRPVASDPDKDTLKFTYSTPLNGSGQWQTTYGDAGQYTVTITASDSELTSSKDALLIVNKKEEAPTINSFVPTDISIETEENTKTEFKITASDLNKDPLTTVWKLDGNEVSTTESFTYNADYSSAGSHTVKVDVSDGTSTTSHLWSITVKNVDRAPVLKPIPDITVKETELVSITPEATDPDEDKINYTVEWPTGKQTEWDGATAKWQTTYDDSGVYSVKVTASDGELSDTQEVKVTVINVNRPPVIENIIQV
jgi:hypothetical protein